MMKVMVLGATGATGQGVVKQLLDADIDVAALVRDTDVLGEHPRLQQIAATALSMEPTELEQLVGNSDAIICCLGHNLTLQGVYGAPRMLVRDSLRRIISSVDKQRSQPLKLVLMSSTGVRNVVTQERIPTLETALNFLLRWLLPPHRDNEQAAKLLHSQEINNTSLEWVMVRPDTLIDRSEVSQYDWFVSPTRSALFDAGETSRINVANAMYRLVSDESLWQQWKGKSPVIYNQQTE